MVSTPFVSSDLLEFDDVTGNKNELEMIVSIKIRTSEAF